MLPLQLTKQISRRNKYKKKKIIFIYQGPDEDNVDKVTIVNTTEEDQEIFYNSFKGVKGQNNSALVTKY